MSTISNDTRTAKEESLRILSCLPSASLSIRLLLIAMILTWPGVTSGRVAAILILIADWMSAFSITSFSEKPLRKMFKIFQGQFFVRITSTSHCSRTWHDLVSKHYQYADLPEKLTSTETLCVFTNTSWASFTGDGDGTALGGGLPTMYCEVCPRSSKAWPG